MGSMINFVLMKFRFNPTGNAALEVYFLTLYFFIIVFREIDLLIYPRLWAEEGDIFLRFARHHTVLETFLTIQVGYITLFNSIVSTIQSRLFEVENIAMVSTVCGLIIQCIPLFIITYTTHPFWDTIYKKVICCITIILVTPAETWLNTTNSHFHFGFITFLIMLTPTVALNKFQKWSFRILLVLGNLSGPASIFLTPFFFLKYRSEKTTEKKIQMIIQTGCAILQSAVIVYYLIYNNHYHRLNSPLGIYSIVYNFFSFNFLLGVDIQSMRTRIFLELLMLVYVIYLFVKNKSNKEQLIVLSSFLIVAFFSTLGSINMAGSPRYGYTPVCIFVIIVVAEIFPSTSNLIKTRQRIAKVILTSALAIHIVQYKTEMKEVYSPSYPIWENEVKKWRIDNNYKPRIHPVYEGAYFDVRL